MRVMLKFYAFGPQGNAVQHLNGAGNVIGAAMYDSYGSATSTNWAGNPFGYGARFGYYTDPESGLCLLTYRYYSPAHGSFLTRDPSGAEPYLYAYAKQNPVTGHDPGGLADIIAVPGIPGFPDHEYIRFNLIQCQIPGVPCNKKHRSSFGFWPSGSDTWSEPGKLNGGFNGEPDPEAPGGRENNGGARPPASGLEPNGCFSHDNNLGFELALCDCIAQSSQNLPNYRFPIYVCYDWAGQMFECASYGSGMNGLPIGLHNGCGVFEL